MVERSMSCTMRERISTSVGGNWEAWSPPPPHSVNPYRYRDDVGVASCHGDGGSDSADLASVKDVRDELDDNTTTNVVQAELLTKIALHGEGHIAFNKFLKKARLDDRLGPRRIPCL